MIGQDNPDFIAYHKERKLRLAAEAFVEGVTRDIYRLEMLAKESTQMHVHQHDTEVLLGQLRQRLVPVLAKIDHHAALKKTK